MPAPYDPNSTFSTGDLYYAAYLKVAGVSFIDVRRESPTRVVFVFESNPNLDDLRRDYYNREGKVPALTYADEVKAMKSLTFSK